MILALEILSDFEQHFHNHETTIGLIKYSQIEEGRLTQKRGEGLLLSQKMSYHRLVFNLQFHDDYEIPELLVQGVKLTQNTLLIVLKGDAVIFVHIFRLLQQISKETHVLGSDQLSWTIHFFYTN